MLGYFMLSPTELGVNAEHCAINGGRVYVLLQMDRIRLDRFRTIHFGFNRARTSIHIGAVHYAKTRIGFSQ